MRFRQIEPDCRALPGGIEDRHLRHGIDSFLKLSVENEYYFMARLSIVGESILQDPQESRVGNLEPEFFNDFAPHSLYSKLPKFNFPAQRSKERLVLCRVVAAANQDAPFLSKHAQGH